MNEKNINTLELNKVLLMLSEMTCCDDSAQAALSLMPLTDPREVEAELDKTDTAYKLSLKFSFPHFFRIENPVPNIKRSVAGSVLSMGELLKISEVLRQARSLSEWYSHCETEENTGLNDYFNCITPNKYLENKITSSIISDNEMDDNASAALSAIRRKIRNAGLKIRDILEKLTRSPSYQKYLQDNIITMRDGRYVVPVKYEHRGDVPGLVHDTSSSGATLFVEPVSVVERNNEIKVLLGQESDEIERILSELSSECAEFSDSMILNYEMILALNLYFAKANLALKMKASKPVISNKKISLKNARHPLIDAKKAVPINIELGERFSSLIITGPNTGGKTVSLKTLGLLSLMAMCGMMIPADDGSVVSVFHEVLADIGDEQSIEQNLSTFSSHMTNIVNILDRANENSLVLLDELGSGTDPAEGAALAIAIIEELSKKGSILAATTHYAELKMYAIETDGVENACCEFNVETLKPTYKLLIGVPGHSNAFAISSKLGLKDSLLERAKALVSNENKRFENVVDNLERSRQEYERLNEELNVKTLEIERLKRESEDIKKNLQQDKERELEKARQQAKRIVDNIKYRSDELIKELDEIRKQKDKEDFAKLAAAAKSQARGGLEKLYDEANPVKESENAKEEYKLPRKLKTGDMVLIVDIDKKGVVQEPPDKKGTVLVQAGIIKSRVHIRNLRLINDAAYSKDGVKVSGVTREVKSGAEREVNMEIDLRGKSADEAVMDLDAYIDNCVLSGVHQIRIIHGKGTGVLRSAISVHLRKHKNIRTFRLGVFGEGENGVTIAELK